MGGTVRVVQEIEEEHFFPGNGRPVFEKNEIILEEEVGFMGFSLQSEGALLARIVAEDAGR